MSCCLRNSIIAGDRLQGRQHCFTLKRFTGRNKSIYPQITVVTHSTDASSSSNETKLSQSNDCSILNIFSSEIELNLHAQHQYMDLRKLDGNSFTHRVSTLPRSKLHNEKLTRFDISNATPPPLWL